MFYEKVINCSSSKINKLKDWVQGAFGLVNTWRFRERCTYRGHGNSVPFPIPTHPLHLAMLELHPFIINL